MAARPRVGIFVDAQHISGWPAGNGNAHPFSFAIAAGHIGYQVICRYPSYKESTGDLKGEVDALLGFLIGRAILTCRL